ncbi:MAG: D-alanyl-D-alanine carboxypeptidase [Patescibacteria group bacterium]|nr:D-alanyl-D-alanine carboxypeptidase [Patescibacteria group bacterium]
MLNKFFALFEGRWKIFLISLVAQLLLTVVLHAGLHAPKELSFLSLPSFTKADTSTLANPLPTQNNFWDNIKSKLEQKKNSFQLKKESGLIPSAYASADYGQSKSYIAVDTDSGEVLAANNSATRLPIASLTKIMTAVVALDLASPNERFTVSPTAAAIQPTKIGVVPSQTMTLDELLHGTLMTSANDSVQVIREGIDQKYASAPADGSGQDVFVRAMNEKAKILGLKNTHFSNPQGFDDPGNYSSAEDLAILSRYALENYPEIASIAKEDYQFLPADNYHKQFDLYNWNGLLDVYPGTYGLKIGNTDGAGYTTVAASERDGHKVLVVLLGTPGVLERDLWAGELLDNSFVKFGLDPVGVTSNQLQAKYATWKYWG